MQLGSPAMNGHLLVKRTLSFACKQVGDAISYLQKQHNALTVYITLQFLIAFCIVHLYEGWNFNGGNYLFTTDTK